MYDELGIYFRHNLGEMKFDGNLKVADEGPQLCSIVRIDPVDRLFK
jgi:hypothetical protein